MQRCRARIAGLSTLACRPCPPRLPTTPSRPYAQHSHDPVRPHLQHSSDPSRPHAQHSHDPIPPHATPEPVRQDAQETDHTPKRPERPLRQAAIRQAQAMSDPAFAYIARSKFPTGPDASSEKAWMSAIEAALPPHLSDPSATPITDEPYSPQDISRIIQISSRTHGLDLLTYLAVDLNRWKAAVWLASQVVEHNFKPEPTFPRDNNVWNTCRPQNFSLASFTQDNSDSAVLNRLPQTHANDLPSLPSLDQLTADLHPLEEPLPRIMRHESLGQVWQSLGRMILRDAVRANKDPVNQAIKPEILEIIAMLHHSGAMPESIYSYQPPDDPLSLCQPPTLHLLSNQIITSLTDAAWNAHAAWTAELAGKQREKGAFHNPLGPEIPGSMYNVRVTGLGHEIWLELVLWACLYGRFYLQGAKVLTDLANQYSANQWSVLSWRELANPIIQSGQERSINWDEVKYVFNAGVSDTDQTVNKKKVRRTVSAEVIASFVDAVVSNVALGVGSRGLSPVTPARFLKSMKTLFMRNNMSLGYTSWDAIVLRFFDSNSVDFDKDPALARRINQISSLFGEELATVNAPTRNQLWQSTPAYVLDGTAANIGHYHRLLRAHIKLGSLGGAMKVIEDLQRLTDINKERSIQEFFKKQQDDPAQFDNQDTSEFGFEGRYGGIHYPSFFLSIPVPLLADLLDLALDSNALELGQWLVYSPDLDGPLIHKGLYKDPVMGPPLVRLAAALSDRDLMSQVFDSQKRASNSSLPKDVLTALLEQQIEAANWPFVEKTLDTFAKLPGYDMSLNTAAIMVRMILREAKTCNGDLAALEKSASSRTFQKMSSFRTPDTNSQLKTAQLAQADHVVFNVELGRSIWHLLALVNDEWRAYAWKAYPRLQSWSDIDFTARTFNRILDGVVDTYGSATGKAYLSKFWLDYSQDLPSSSVSQDTSGGVPRMAARREDTPVLTSQGRIARHRIHIDGPGRKKGRVQVDLRFKPNIATIQTILSQALKECDGQIELLKQEVTWAWTMLKKLRLQDDLIWTELRSMPELQNHPDLFPARRSAEADFAASERDLDNALNEGLKEKSHELEE